jgi:hypothetical protein
MQYEWGKKHSGQKNVNLLLRLQNLKLQLNESFFSYFRQLWEHIKLQNEHFKMMWHLSRRATWVHSIKTPRVKFVRYRTYHNFILLICWS